MSDRSLVRLNLELATEAEAQYQAAERRAAALLEEARQLERAAADKIRHDQQAARAAEQRRKARVALEAANLAAAERRALVEHFIAEEGASDRHAAFVRTRLGIRP